MPFKHWQPWLKRDVDWLAASITDMGGFTVSWPGGPSKGYGDNANAQYAALGLWGAEQAGYDVDPELWKKIDAYWRAAQLPADKDGAAGWAILSQKAIKPDANANAFANRVASPMT